MAGYHVYIVTNAPRGTLYVGVTNDLVRRVHEHREALIKISRRNMA
jgi:putative endonuclease